MVKIYKNVLGRKSSLLGSGKTFKDAVRDAYDNDKIKAFDELWKESYKKQIEALADHVTAASQDYIIERKII